METGDIITKKIRKGTRSCYQLNLQVDWLKYVGFTQEEIDSGEIDLLIKFDLSRTEIKFMGMGKKVQQAQVVANMRK